MNHTGDRMGATVDDTSKCAAPLIEHVFGPVYVLDLFMCGPADWLCNAFDTMVTSCARLRLDLNQAAQQ